MISEMKSDFDNSLALPLIKDTLEFCNALKYHWFTVYQFKSLHNVNICSSCLLRSNQITPLIYTEHYKLCVIFKLKVTFQ